MGSSSEDVPIWSLPEVVEYFRADAEIAEAMSESDFAEVINVEATWVKLVRNALEYQGFDPRVILSQLIRNRKSYDSQKPNDLKWDLSNVGDDLKWKPDTLPENLYTNKSALSKDINFMITIFLARNNHINKIIKKARGGVEEILNMLKEKYVIDDDIHKSGTSLESRTITLPRIAGVFPGTAVRMFHDRAVKEIVTYESFPGTSKPDSHSISCPLLPSVCPNELTPDKGGVFHPVMIWTAIKLDEIIHRKDKEITSLIDLLGYYRAAFQSAAVPEKSRQTIFIHLGLATLKKKNQKDEILSLTDTSKALVANCLSSLGQMRVDDGNHELMMKVAKTGDMTLF